MSQWQILFRKHNVPAMDQTPRKGRNQYEGYVRGCGLQFGNIADLCRNDPDFQSAISLARDKTVVGPAKLMNLFVLFKVFLPKLAPGAIAEFGSFKGGSAIFMAYLAQRFLNGAKVYAFDTYAGMPATDRQIDAHKAGDFADADMETIQQFAAANGLDNLVCVKGRFEDTAPTLLPTIGKLSLVHIDCDIYSAAAYSYDACKPYMNPGGYLVFDDPLEASCLGAFEAVEELLIHRDGLYAEQAMPHLVYRYPPLG